RLDRAQVTHHLLFEVAQDVCVTHGLNRAWRATNAGRVADHDVDAGEVARRRVDEVLDRVGIQRVTDDGDNLVARFVRQLSGCLLQRSFGTGANGDVAALECKLAGDSPADASAGAGDDGFLAGELQVHWFLLRACTLEMRVKLAAPLLLGKQCGLLYCGLSPCRREGSQNLLSRNGQCINAYPDRIGDRIRNGGSGWH